MALKFASLKNINFQFFKYLTKLLPTLYHIETLVNTGRTGSLFNLNTLGAGKGNFYLRKKNYKLFFREIETRTLGSCTIVHMDSTHTYFFY